MRPMRGSEGCLPMTFDPEEILSILDRCCDAFTFPMLDNGYVYLAATRLSLYRSTTDWAMVIEVFGFSPRAGLPDTSIQTFASRLHDRDRPEELRQSTSVREVPCQQPEQRIRAPSFRSTRDHGRTPRTVSSWPRTAREVVVRDQAIPLPAWASTHATVSNWNRRPACRCLSSAGSSLTSRVNRCWRRRKNGVSASFQRWNRFCNWKNGIIRMWLTTRSGRAAPRRSSNLLKCSPREM